MSQYDFYKNHLQKVSRSFAFCIHNLSDPFRTHVAYMYLVCRVLDTIEDSEWPVAESQTNSFNQFLDQLNQKDIPTLKLWQSSFPRSITKDEKALIDESEQLIDDFQEFSPEVQEIFIELFETMSSGMMAYQSRHKSDQNLEIKSSAELNEYCYYVAGIVGTALTQVFAALNDDFEASDENIKAGLHFGLYLQKINLLKDQLTDAEEGRHFIFNRYEILHSLNLHAKEALKYVLNIPVKHKDYRQFCLWSLFLALGSMPYIEKSYLEKKPIKISRFETKFLIMLVNSVVDHNILIERFFNKYRSMTLHENFNNEDDEELQYPQSSDLKTKISRDVAREVILNA